jgi:hypothetical protein
VFFELKDSEGEFLKEKIKECEWILEDVREKWENDPLVKRELQFRESEITKVIFNTLGRDNKRLLKIVSPELIFKDWYWKLIGWKAVG